MVSTSLSNTPQVDKSRNSRLTSGRLDEGLLESCAVAALHNDLATGRQGIRSRREVRAGDSAGDRRRTDRLNRKNTMG
jgi:hypothetical protein